MRKLTLFMDLLVVILELPFLLFFICLFYYASRYGGFAKRLVDHFEKAYLREQTYPLLISLVIWTTLYILIYA